MRRLVLAALPLLLVVGIARPASAHPVERFTACVALTTTTPECSRQGAVLEAGATAYLRGRVSPAHPGFGEVWWRAPSSDRFVRVGTMGVNEQGRIRWSWRTTTSDIASTPHTFQFRLPGHGRSWTTKVRVRSPRRSTVALCAAVSSTDSRCYHAGITVEAIRAVHLRGRVQPAGSAEVEVLRRRPHGSWLDRFATVRSAADGTVRWVWSTRPADTDGHAPYLFALQLPTGERSNLVEVWVVPRGDPSPT